jgi:hypothetical protein
VPSKQLAVEYILLAGLSKKKMKIVQSFLSIIQVLNFLLHASESTRGYI